MRVAYQVAKFENGELLFCRERARFQEGLPSLDKPRRPSAALQLASEMLFGRGIIGITPASTSIVSSALISEDQWLTGLGVGRPF